MRKRSKKEKKGGHRVRSKNSPENLVEKILELDAIEFLGICKICGVEVYEQGVTTFETVEEDVEGGQAIKRANVKLEPREFTDIWSDLCDTIESMNRVRRRNLGRLIYAATKSKKEN